MYAYIFRYIYIHIEICTYIYVYTYILVFLYTYTCVYVYMGCVLCVLPPHFKTTASTPQGGVGGDTIGEGGGGVRAQP